MKSFSRLHSCSPPPNAKCYSVRTRSLSRLDPTNKGDEIIIVQGDVLRKKVGKLAVKQSAHRGSVCLVIGWNNLGRFGGLRRDSVMILLDG